MSTGDKTVDKILERRKSLQNEDSVKKKLIDDKGVVVQRKGPPLPGASRVSKGPTTDPSRLSQQMKKEIEEGAKSGEAEKEKQNPPTK